MDNVKTDDELTSTMGNVLSTSKEEKNDSSDATPTSSTDANTNPTASQTVSDDPISSTSSDLFEQSKLPEMKLLPTDELDKVHSEDHVGDLLAIRTSNEKITEDVEDLVHDLESLLGETVDTFSLSSKKKSIGEGNASVSKSSVPKISPSGKAEDKCKKEVDDGLQKETLSNLVDSVDIVKENNIEKAYSDVTVSITENNQEEVLEKSGEKVEVVENTVEKLVEVQSPSETTIQDQPVASGVEISPQEGSTNSAVEDQDSMGSWELVDVTEAESIANPMPGPSGEPVLAQFSRNTAEDITSSGDKDPSTAINDDGQGTREAESIPTEGNNPTDELVQLHETTNLVSEEGTSKAEKGSEEATEEVEEMETEEVIEAEGKVAQNIETPDVITSSEVTGKDERIVQEETPSNKVKSDPKTKETENIGREDAEKLDQNEESAKEENVEEMDDPTESKAQSSKDLQKTVETESENVAPQSEEESKETRGDSTAPAVPIPEHLQSTDNKQAKIDQTEAQETTDTFELQDKAPTSDELEKMEVDESAAKENTQAEPKDEPAVYEPVASENIDEFKVVEPGTTELDMDIFKPEVQECKESQHMEAVGPELKEEILTVTPENSDAAQLEEKKIQKAETVAIEEKVDTEEIAAVNDEKLSITQTIEDTEVTKEESQLKEEKVQDNIEETINEELVAEIQASEDSKPIQNEDEKPLQEEITVKVNIADVPELVGTNSENAKPVEKEPAEAKPDEIEPVATIEPLKLASIEDKPISATKSEDAKASKQVEDEVEEKMNDNATAHNENQSQLTHEHTIEEKQISQLKSKDSDAHKEVEVKVEEKTEMINENLIENATPADENQIRVSKDHTSEEKETLQSKSEDFNAHKEVEEKTEIIPENLNKNAATVDKNQIQSKEELATAESVTLHTISGDTESEKNNIQNKPLAELQFAPLELSEDDSDDSETVPRLALEPDESNSPATIEPIEIPSPQTQEEEKAAFVPPVTDTPDNLETILAVASLQSIEIPKSNEMDHVVSEKERREMEALARAVESISGGSSNQYVEEYIEPTVLQEEATVIPIVREADSLVGNQTEPESIPSQDAVPVIESRTLDTVEEPAVFQVPEPADDKKPEQEEPSTTRKSSDSEVALKDIKNYEAVQEVVAPIAEPESVLSETENIKPLVQVEATRVESEQEPSTTVQEADSFEHPVERGPAVNEIMLDKAEAPIQEVANIQKNVLAQEEFVTSANATVVSSNDIKETEKSSDRVRDTDDKSSKIKEIHPNTTTEVSKPAKEGKTRSNEKSKKHKKADKYEELTINVDVPDREKTYSPKITIKPLKAPEEEVSTTTSSESDVGKGSLKMTITKQSDNTHSILKISDQENSEALPEQEEPIPKLIIKPKMQQVEQQHSPKMSTRSSRHSPTASNPKSGSPRITIKPVVKPDKQEPVSPLKIKINTKANAKGGNKEEEITRKVLIKPVVKPVEEPEQIPSPRITIKPIPKPDSEKEANPRLTIKPIKKPEEDIENEDKERSSPKITIKPIVKPQESEISEEEEEVKKRIVLKINKGNLPSPAKESKKREHPPDEDKSEKLAKITVKFSKEGGHPHIVQQQQEDPHGKRPHEEPQATVEKNKKFKVEPESNISTRSSRHKDQQDDKSNPGAETKTKHKDHSHESPVETKRSRKENLHDKSKLIDNPEDFHLIESKIDSPIVISEDSRSQDSGSLIMLDENKDEDIKAVVRGGESSAPSPVPRKRGRPRKDSGGSANLTLPEDSKDDSIDRVKTPDSSKGNLKTILAGRDSATPSPVPKKRGRPRKEFQVPLEVREVVQPLEDSSKSKEAESSPQVHESGRPKRSCRGQSVCDTLGIKPRKSRGGGARGRGGKRGVGNRAVDERDLSSLLTTPFEEVAKVEEKNLPSREEPPKSEVIVIDDEDKIDTTPIILKRIFPKKRVEVVIEIDSGDSQPSEKDSETDKNVEEIPKDSVEDAIQPMEVDDRVTEIKAIEESNPKPEIQVPADPEPEIHDKLAVLEHIEIANDPIVEEKKKEVINEEIPKPFAVLAPPAIPKDFSHLAASNPIVEPSSPCKSSHPEISSVGSTTIPSEVMIVDEDTRMSAETNSRAQTPAKQVVTSSDIVEESQSSMHSTATTESGKTPSRPSKAPRLEVQEPESQIITADILSEYYWNGNGPFMLQEQVAQFLGIKSFKRKYPGIMRRMLDMQERDFIREKGLASEHMCDLGLTAVNSADILDIMYSDFQEKYEEYCKYQRDRQAKELINKQRALSLAASQDKSKADITEQAVQSAAQWNARFNKTRKEERKACMDLQNLTVHYPKSKMTTHMPAPHPGNYPVALVPGQFAEFYKEFTPTELNNLPINTICYDEVNFVPRENSDESGSESDSDSSSSGSSSSGSDSDSSSGIDDCKLCKHSPKKASTASAATSAPVAVAASVAK